MNRKYNKGITLHYQYINSPDADRALAEVFDDIFARLAKKLEKKENNIPGTFTETALDKGQENNKFIVDNS